MRSPWPPAITPASVSDGVHWIAVRPAVIRRFTVATYIAAAAFVAFGGAPVFLMWRGAPGTASSTAALGLLAMVLLAQLLVLRTLRRAFRVRLGTDGRDFFLDPGKGEPERYPLASLATANERQLLAGKRLIPLYGSLGPMFDLEEVRRHIFARMAPASRVGVLRLFGRALRQGNELIWTTVAVALVALVVFVPYLFLYRGHA